MTAAALQSSAPASPDRSSHGLAPPTGRRPVPVLALAGVLLLVIGVAADVPLLVLSALTTATVAGLRRWLPLDLAVPAAALAVLGVALLAGLTADVAGTDLLQRPALLIAAYGAWVLLPVVRPPAGTVGRAAATPYGRAAWAAHLPSALVLLIALRAALDERLSASWALLVTDPGVHMLEVQRVQDTGALDYGVSSYPRAFHALAAFVSVPGRALDDPGTALGYDLRLVAATACAALALLSWTCACTVLRLAADRSVPRGVAVSAAGLGACAVVLVNGYVAAFVYQAATASLLASVVLWALPLSVLALEGTRHRLLGLTLVAMTAVLLLAHLWQPLVLCPVLALLAHLALRLRHPRRLLRELCPTPRLTVLLVGWGTCCTVGALVPLLAVLSDGGMSLASIPGLAPAPPRALVFGAAATAAVLLGRLRSGVDRVQLGVLAGLVLALAAMLRSNGQGFDLTQYYPQKVLWFLTISTLPVSALVAVAVLVRVSRGGWGLLGRSGRYVGVVRPAGIAIAVSMLLVYVAAPLSVTRPLVLSLAAPPAGTSEGVRRLELAREHAFAHQPAVAVPVSLGQTLAPDHHQAKIVSRLLSFQTGQVVNVGEPDGVCADVRSVAGGRPAVVVTALQTTDLRRLMRNRGCGEVPVVQVPGGGMSPLFLPRR